MPARWLQRWHARCGGRRGLRHSVATCPLRKPQGCVSLRACHDLSFTVLSNSPPTPPPPFQTEGNAGGACAGRFDAVAQWPVLYGELRRQAARLMAQERAGHTLSPTGLVHEAWLKLSAGAQPLQLADRPHFMALAARAMRHILVNHALARRADKRQGNAVHGTLSLADQVPLAQASPDELLAVDQALSRLADDDARAAQVAELKVFAGMDVSEIAAALGVSEPTVKRDWVYARARLAQLIA